MQRDHYAFDDFHDDGAHELTAPARIVATPRGLRFALAVHTTLEIVEHPRPWSVPGAAPHALGLLEWQGRRIPFIDADSILRGSTLAGSARYALVLAWQGGAGARIEHGAIAIDALPDTVLVGDSARCAPPEDIAAHPIAAFMHGGSAIAVLDPAELFVTAASAPEPAA